jgi:AmiR/NasT family two-component response regulator
MKRVESAEEKVRLAIGELQVELPAETPPEALAVVQQLLAQIDGLVDRTAQLHVALDSRIAIEQAKGVIAERQGVTPEEAFEMLRATARRRRVPLHALAETVVASASLGDAGSVSGPAA